MIIWTWKVLHYTHLQKTQLYTTQLETDTNVSKSLCIFISMCLCHGGVFCHSLHLISIYQLPLSFTLTLPLLFLQHYQDLLCCKGQMFTWNCWQTAGQIVHTKSHRRYITKGLSSNQSSTFYPLHTYLITDYKPVSDNHCSSWTWINCEKSILLSLAWNITSVLNQWEAYPEDEGSFWNPWSLQHVMSLLHRVLKLIKRYLKNHIHKQDLSLALYSSPPLHSLGTFGNSGFTSLRFPLFSPFFPIGGKTLRSGLSTNRNAS